jgi:hypothetical protein
MIKTMGKKCLQQPTTSKAKGETVDEELMKSAAAQPSIKTTERTECATPVQNQTL